MIYTGEGNKIKFLIEEFNVDSYKILINLLFIAFFFILFLISLQLHQNEVNMTVVFALQLYLITQIQIAVQTYDGLTMSL